MCKYKIVDRFLKNELEIRETSKQEYERNVVQLLDEVSNILHTDNEEEIIKQLDSDLIEDVVFKFQDKYEKKTTYNNKVISIKKFCKYLLRKGIKTVDISKTTKVYKKLNKKSKEFLTKNELISVTSDKNIKLRGNKIKTIRTQFLIGLLSSTGLRKEEALNITMDKLEKVYDEDKFVGYVCRFTPDENKTKIYKTVGIGGECLELLNEYIINRNELVKEDNNYLFVNDKGDNRLPKQTATDNIVSLMNKCGINKNICPHSMRYSFKTIASMNYSDEIVRQIGGWTNNEVSDTYLHPSDLDIIEVCNCVLD